METIETKLESLKAAWKVKADNWQRFIQNQPQTIQCEVHGQPRQISEPLSAEASAQAWTQTAVYSPCPECQRILEASRVRARMQKNGVPELLLNATLENWTPRDAEEGRHIAKVYEFSGHKRGFLMLCGKVGTGKSHLAAAVMRTMDGQGWFTTQSGFLKALRATYDGAEFDPIERAKHARLFILDECGVSVGGKDEGPALYDALNHRFNTKAPTIITTNLDASNIGQALGERIVDRLREGLFACLNFNGESHRKGKRAEYLADNHKSQPSE